MEDLFNPEQAHRVFGFIAVGGSQLFLTGYTLGRRHDQS